MAISDDSIDSTDSSARNHINQIIIHAIYRFIKRLFIAIILVVDSHKNTEYL